MYKESQQQQRRYGQELPRSHRNGIKKRKKSVLRRAELMLKNISKIMPAIEIEGPPHVYLEKWRQSEIGQPETREEMWGRQRREIPGLWAVFAILKLFLVTVLGTAQLCTCFLYSAAALMTCSWPWLGFTVSLIWSLCMWKVFGQRIYALCILIGLFLGNGLATSLYIASKKMSPETFGLFGVFYNCHESAVDPIRIPNCLLINSTLLTWAAYIGIWVVLQAIIVVLLKRIWKHWWPPRR